MSETEARGDDAPSEAVDIPPVETTEVDDLSVDGDNPNEQTDEQFAALKQNIEEYGFIVPIITNRDGVIADGEHRWRAARDMGMESVPVVQLDVGEVDRRIIRQVMNKVSGSHDMAKDAAEFDRILNAQSASVDYNELAERLATDTEDIEGTLELWHDRHESPDGDGENGADGPAIDEDGMPESFDEVDGVETEHECPNCGYEW